MTFQPEIEIVAELESNNKKIFAEFEQSDTILQGDYQSLDANIPAKFEKQCNCENGEFVNFQTLKGQDGYTPVKGVDYFTEEDVDEIAEKAYELVQTGGVDTSTFLKVSQIGKHLELDANKKLNVVTTDVAESGNNTPITSSAVNTIVGNIDILLGII